MPAIKKILMPAVLLLCCCYTYGQIQTITSKKVPDHVKYDSLKNYLGLNVYAYMGQELYLRPVAESLRKYGYMGFYTQPIDDPAHYKTNTYKCCNSFNAAYDSLQGKYFTVVAITRHPQAAQNDYLYGKKYFFKLVEKENRDTCYYEYDGSLIDDMFPFTVVGYYEKCKKRYIGRKYTTLGKRWTNNDLPEKDIETAKDVAITPGKLWTVVDVSIDDVYYNLCLILKSQQGEKVAISISAVLQGCYYICPAK